MPGNQVADWDKYHAILKEVGDKTTAAKIVNSQAQKNAISDRLRKERRNGSRSSKAKATGQD
jgi:hypothetical protein